jgi:hypothetical protein
LINWTSDGFSRALANLSLDDFTESPMCSAQVIRLLHVKPKLRCGAEVTREPKRRVRRDGPGVIQDLRDATCQRPYGSHVFHRSILSAANPSALILANNTQAWELQSNGSYRCLLPDGQESASAQVNLLCELAENS